MNSPYIAKNRMTMVIVTVSLLFSLSLPTLSSAQDPACPVPEPGLGMISYHELMLFQGDNPNTPEIEPDSLVKASDKTRWIVPWNASYVYVSVPESSYNVAITNVEYDGVDFVAGRYNLPDGTMPPQYSLVTTGNAAGSYKWEIPAEAPRYTTVKALYNSSGLDQAYDNDTGMANIDEWNFTQDSMRLAAGIPSANYTSKMENIGYDIVSINISLNSSSNSDNITFLISEDDGDNWMEVEFGMRMEMSAVSAEMRFMIQMSQDTDLNNTPVIDDLLMDIEFIPDNIDVWLETSYDIDIPADGIDFSIHLTYDIPDMPIYYVGYFDEEIHVESGFQVTTTAFETLPGKMVYMTMGEGHSDHLSFSIRMPTSSNEMSTSTSVIIVLIFVILTMSIVGLYLRKYALSDDKDESEDEKDENDPQTSEDESSVSESSAKDIIEDKPDRSDITNRKKILEDTIARLDTEVSSGLISASVAERMKTSYNEELDEINSQLGEEGDIDASSDNDIIEERSAELEDLKSSKSEVINKLKDLDQRLENGEVSDEEHAILKASYKKQAIDIMKKMDSIE